MVQKAIEIVDPLSDSVIEREGERVRREGRKNREVGESFPGLVERAVITRGLSSNGFPTLCGPNCAIFSGIYLFGNHHLPQSSSLFCHDSTVVVDFPQCSSGIWVYIVNIVFTYLAVTNTLRSTNQ